VGAVKGESKMKAQDCQLVRVFGVASKDPKALEKIAPYKGMTVVGPGDLPKGIVDNAYEMFYDVNYKAEYSNIKTSSSVSGGAIRPIGTGMDYFQDSSGYYYIVATHAIPSSAAEELGDIMEVFMVDCSLPAPGMAKSKVTPFLLAGALIGTVAMAFVLFRK
jgi:hypothetical protein